MSHYKNIEVSENPSPSGDSWFNDPENIASVNRGIEDIKAGKGRGRPLLFNSILAKLEFLILISLIV